MSRSKWVWTTLALIAALTATPAFAKPASKPGGPKAPKTTSAKPVKATTPTKGSGPKSTAPSMKPVKSTAGASAKGGSHKGATAKAPNKSPKTTAAASTSTATTSKTTTTTSTTGTTTNTGTPATTWVPNNPVAEKLSTKPQHLSRVKAVLPEGTNLNTATAGFKNYGQFLAAVNVSNNLDIPFADLKLAMTGLPLTTSTTGGSSSTPSTSNTTSSTEPAPTMSLGQAIKKLRPGVDADAEAAKATRTATVEAQ